LFSGIESYRLLPENARFPPALEIGQEFFDFVADKIQAVIHRIPTGITRVFIFFRFVKENQHALHLSDLGFIFWNDDSHGQIIEKKILGFFVLFQPIAQSRSAANVDIFFTCLEAIAARNIGKDAIRPRLRSVAFRP